MAFEADCDLSTVLEMFCVTRTSGYLDSGGFRGNPPQQRHADWGLWKKDGGRGTSNSKSEIRNPKSIRVLYPESPAVAFIAAL